MKKPTLEEITKNIDWNRALFTIIPLLQPFIIFGAWLAFSRMSTKAGVLSKFISIAEVVPAVDLNLPKEVVLASMFDFSSDAIDLLNKILDTILDPLDIKETKEALNVLYDLAVKGEATVGGPVGTVTREQILDYIKTYWFE